MMNLYYPQMSSRLMLLLLSLFVTCASAETLVFNCTRVERDFKEVYELKVSTPTPNSGAQKGKVYLDGRDLDRRGDGGNQTIKNVVISKDRISYLSDTHFEAEVFDGISYPPGSVLAVVILDRRSGRLRRVETVSGGILALSLGEGTKSYDEECVPANHP
jgi:hypothetical protein